jgi:hypothetical protein
MKPGFLARYDATTDVYRELLTNYTQYKKASTFALG